MDLWLIVIAMGIVTSSIRLSMLVFVHHGALPRLSRDALTYTTPAVLTAIILPAVLYVGADDDFQFGLGNERFVAAIAAALVARLTSNVWLTIGSGMCLLWLLEALT